MYSVFPNYALIKFIYFSDFIGPPSEPQNLQVVSCSPQSVRVSWEPPKKDGGDPVKQYVIELRATHENDFVKVGKVKGGNLSYEAIGLITGQDYIVRVRAVNAIGESESAAELKEPVTAKLPFRKLAFASHGLLFKVYIFCYVDA